MIIKNFICDQYNFMHVDKSCWYQTVQIMSYIQNSENFTWETSNILGRGAFGCVYKGVNKNTGEDVAVKVFNYNSSKLPVEIQMREFEVMKKLSHKNIVKVLAIEYEVQYGKKVLVMELCRGGNLQTILNEPKNIYGLEEEEFLCVLKDLTVGLKYMRDNKIVHRDIKPFNILKYISDNGRSLYKYADFGAARYLDDDQQFQSLHGTEEYLHPDMFERAFFHCGDESFEATVDLWSIGTTIYQLATGSVPFQPYEGKKDKKAMLFITSKKPPGAISGIQYRRDPESVIWSKELPKTCLLNRKLQDLITVVLAGVLESDRQKAWTFPKFFEHVTDIITRKVFHVFYISEGKEIILYMQPDKKVQDLQHEISSQTDVPPSDQILFFNETRLSQIDPSSDVSMLPSTSPDKPFILMQKLNGRNEIQVEAFRATFSEFSSSKEFDVVKDISWVKKCYHEIYTSKCLIKKLVRCQDLMLKFPKILISLIVEDVEKMCSDSDILKLKLDDISCRSDLLKNISTIVSQFIKSNKNLNKFVIIWDRMEKISEQMKRNNEKKRKVLKLQEHLIEIKQRVLISKTLQNEWGLQALSESSSLVGCVQLADTYVERIHESLQILSKINPANGHMIKVDQSLRLQHLKMQTYCKKLNLLKEECLNASVQTFNKLADWYCGISTFMVQCACLKEDLISGCNDFKSVSTPLQSAETELLEITTQVIAAFIPPDIQLQNCNKSDYQKQEYLIIGNTGEDLKQHEEILSKLRDFEKEQQDLKEIITENESIMESVVNILQPIFELCDSSNKDSAAVSDC